ncbi:MAG: L-aspartate oxidase [Parvularculaceae bacterium]
MMHSDTDILIVGAGVAGLYTALKLAPRPVTIVTARPLGMGGASVWAQGGLAAAVGPDDSPALHLEDTIAAGDGLVDEIAARILVEGGPACVEDLLRIGVPFDRDEAGALVVGREAAHSRDRIVHAAGDQAGAAIMTALIAAAREAQHITILERIVVEDLLTEDGRVAGVLAYIVEKGERAPMPASETVLATGGLGGLYAVTTNPVRAQSHGLAFAARAGAVIRDSEFVQFHPTALDLGLDPAPLATEALRGEGATLVDENGRRFMPDYHPLAELAPRDVVARAVETEIAAGRGAFLDARQSIGPRFPELFPTVFAACEKAGLDPRYAPMPIAPAAHYHMGGVMTDTDGRTSLDGLWAVGEVASTGVHGANRLASNSLLEAVVFGARAADQLRDKTAIPLREPHAPNDRYALPAKPADGDALARLRKTMAADCALLRSKESLARTLDEIDALDRSEAMTSGLKSALVSARLIAAAALAREESRGGHYRTDYPEASDDPLHSLCRYSTETESVKVAAAPPMPSKAVA